MNGSFCAGKTYEVEDEFVKKKKKELTGRAVGKIVDGKER